MGFESKWLGAELKKNRQAPQKTLSLQRLWQKIHIIGKDELSIWKTKRGWCAVSFK
jgi:hypothetical protein